MVSCLSRLDYPNAPLLEVGTRSRPIALPMELCVISPGQRRLKLTPEQTSEMIRHAAARPQVRANFITDTVARTSGFDSDPNLKEFGIKVEPRMIEVGFSCSSRSENRGNWRHFR